MSDSPRPTLDLVRTVAEIAGLAPSVHNTQPWRFRWDGERFEVCEERTRALPALDPSGRERVVSCGAAVLHTRLAFGALGWDATTALLPDGEDGEVLARLQVLGPRPPTQEESDLVAAVPRRATDRDPYDERPVPPEVLTALCSAAAQEGAWLVEVTGDDLVELEVLLARADAAQRADPAYLAELAAWQRDGSTGVASRSLPTADPGARGSSLSLRDFEAGTAEHEHVQVEPPPAEHPTVLLLGTPEDGRRDWLVSGIALGRVLLRATVEAIAAQPVSAVLEVPVLRGRLRSALGLVGHPQMVLRAGYGTSGPSSHRLPVDEVLTIT
jgi:hypothetical protein